MSIMCIKVLIKCDFSLVGRFIKNLFVFFWIYISVVNVVFIFEFWLFLWLFFEKFGILILIGIFEFLYYILLVDKYILLESFKVCLLGNIYFSMFEKMFWVVVLIMVIWLFGSMVRVNVLVVEVVLVFISNIRGLLV